MEPGYRKIRTALLWPTLGSEDGLHHKKRNRDRSGLDLIEEAIQALRWAPLSILLTYFIGTVPFILGFLFFWADMSRGRGADERCAKGALLLVLLFIWMKTWHSVFMVRLRSHIEHRVDPPWTLRRFLQCAYVQIIVQPWGLLLIPIGFALTVPFVWIYAFYQSATLQAGAPDLSIAERIAKARAQAHYDAVQDVGFLFILSFFILFIFINVYSALALFPGLLKILFGIQTVFSISSATMANTTFLSVAAATAFLCSDPITKAVYVFRNFYGESLKSGEDLRVELKQVQSLPGGMRVALLLAAGLLVLAPPAFAEVETGAAVDSAQLEEAINEVMESPIYQWRLPRDLNLDETDEDGFLAKILDGMKDILADFLNWAIDRIVEIMTWMDDLFGSSTPQVTPPGVMATKGLLIIAFVIVIALLLFVLIRMCRNAGPAAEPVMAEAVVSVPDITDESVG
ncbi:MAG: hypothetical protein AAF492_23895, partial [Verrucomicrobiota bacterium]